MPNIVDQQSEIIHNFRRCHLSGCLGMGWWYPVISLSPDGVQRAYLPMKHWLFCDHHHEYIELSDLIDGRVTNGDVAFTRIQEAFICGGKSAPQREFTTLKWREA